MNTEEKSYFIKNDGSLWYGLRILAQPDWHPVNNPKRTYYCEFDKTHPAYKEKISLEEETTNVLPVEVL